MRSTPLDASYKSTSSLVLRDLDSVFLDSPRNGCLRPEAANALRNASAAKAPGVGHLLRPGANTIAPMKA
jgi:hypothetical protein